MKPHAPDAQRLAELHAGEPARTLGEALAIEQSQLLTQLVPDLPPQLRRAAEDAAPLGILARMRAMGRAISEHLAPAQREALTSSSSDTARGWVCFAIAERVTQPAALLNAMREAADDEHFAVREWAWLAARPALAADVDEGIRLLAAWTRDPSERIRRFASEALRPRGVWSRHIPELMREPDRGLPVLEPLRADPARYVQDSVANWINDAAKTRPEWARELCARWRAESDTPETARITRRGLRSLGS